MRLLSQIALRPYDTMLPDNPLRGGIPPFKSSTFPTSHPSESSHFDPTFCCDPACLQLCSLDCTSTCSQDNTTPCTTADCQHDCSDPFCTTYDPCIDDCLSDCSDHCIVDCNDNCSEICTADCTEPSCKVPHCVQSQCSNTPCSSYDTSHDSLDNKMDANQQSFPQFDFQAMSQADQGVNSQGMSQPFFQHFPVVPHQAMSQATFQNVSWANKANDNLAMPQAIQQAHDSVEPEAYQPANTSAFDPCGCSRPGGLGICGFVYADYDSAEAHYKEAHAPHLLPSDLAKDEGKRKFKCPWPNCEQTSVKGQMLRHWIGAHGYPRPHSCATCGRVFATAQQLSNHTTTHTGARPYKCRWCSYDAGVKHAVTTHEQTEHKGKFHECAACNTAITGRTNYNHHVRDFHKYGVQCPGCGIKNRATNKMWDHFVLEDAAHVEAGNPAGTHRCGGQFIGDDESFMNWWAVQEAWVLANVPEYGPWKAEKEAASHDKAAKNRARVAGKKRMRAAPGEEGEAIDNGAASPSKRSRSASGEADADSAAAKAKTRNAERRRVKEAARRDPIKRIRQTFPRDQ